MRYSADLMCRPLRFGASSRVARGTHNLGTLFIVIKLTHGVGGVSNGYAPPCNTARIIDGGVAFRHPTTMTLHRVCRVGVSEHCEPPRVGIEFRPFSSSSSRATAFAAINDLCPCFCLCAAAGGCSCLVFWCSRRSRERCFRVSGGA